jgi:DNA-binding transcriptional regulator YiaG
MTGQELKSFYTGLGLSQIAFAAKLHVTTRTIQHWESGKIAVPPFVADVLLGRFSLAKPSRKA